MFWNRQGEMLQSVSIMVDTGVIEVRDAALDIKKYAWNYCNRFRCKTINQENISMVFNIWSYISCDIHTFYAKTHQSEKPISIEAEVRLW